MDPTSKTFRCVRLNPTSPEPAIDPAAMAEEVTIEGATRSRWASYLVTRDESLLRFRDAMEPTWFHLRRLPAMWLCDVLDGVFSASSQRVLAFRAACHAVMVPGEPLSVSLHGTAGSRFVASPPDRGVSLAPAEWVEEVADRFGLETVQEVGRVAIDHSRLPKGSRGPFGLWHGSVASL